VGREKTSERAQSEGQRTKQKNEKLRYKHRYVSLKREEETFSRTNDDEEELRRGGSRLRQRHTQENGEREKGKRKNRESDEAVDLEKQHQLRQAQNPGFCNLTSAK